MYARISKVFLRVYFAQAAAGGAVGFVLPWLRAFGVI